MLQRIGSRRSVQWFRHWRTIPNDKFGTAAGSFSLSGTAIGTPTELGTGSGSFYFSGTAIGTPVHTGTGSGSFSFSGTAIGAVPVTTGTGSGSFSFSGTALGTPEELATAEGSFSFSGAAIGTPESLGTAAGAFSFTGHARGIFSNWMYPRLMTNFNSPKQRIVLVESRNTDSNAYSPNRSMLAGSRTGVRNIPPSTKVVIGGS